MKRQEMIELFGKLVDIMARLRGEDGCPWDRKQTHQTIVPYTIEETYELADAVEAGDPDRIREELGDLLLQIVFQAQIARDNGNFEIGDVVQTLCQKLIRRHPHVFGTATADSPEQVAVNWDRIKQEDKHNQGSILDGIPRHMPVLQKAKRMQERASRMGFDWDNIVDVWAKVKEEVGEVEAEFTDGQTDRLEEELGDLLFAIVNFARFAGIQPDRALEKTNQKFRRRFRKVERAIQAAGIRELTLEEMDRIWNTEKSEEKSGD